MAEMPLTYVTLSISLNFVFRLISSLALKRSTKCTYEETQKMFLACPRVRVMMKSWIAPLTGWIWTAEMLLGESIFISLKRMSSSLMYYFCGHKIRDLTDFEYKVTRLQSGIGVGNKSHITASFEISTTFIVANDS